MTSTAQPLASAYHADGTERTPPRTGHRIASIDLVRGVVMILMAIDHVRVYAGVPPGGPDPGVFFTRWITHFVAPAFVFLAGTSAYLHGRKLGNRNELAKFLVSRGAFLILLELTVIRIFWTFNLDFANYMLAGVIWMLGWCMILLAAAVYLPVRVTGAIGVAMIALHNVTNFFGDRIGAAFGEAGPHWLLQFLYLGGAVRLGGEAGPPLLVLYVLVPWVGVMMAGHAFGPVVESPVERRRGILLRLGIAATLLFVVLRAADVYGDPNPWRDTEWLPAAFAFLETTKYPASLAFLLMTLGPMLILLALSERWKGRAAEAATVFGRVPMFYYLLHIPVIHVAALIVSLVREGRMNPWLFGNHPLAPPEQPDGYRWSLWLLYLVFALCVIALYFPCRWYAGVRARQRWKWLSHL